MDENNEIPLELPEDEALHKKPLLMWLAKSVFVDSFNEFIKSIWQFIAHHIKLLVDSFRFVWRPFYTGKRVEARQLMNRSKAVFGFLLTVLGILLFLVKVDALVEPDQNITKNIGNEKVALILNLVFFLILSVGYYLLQALLVLFGRLYRLIVSPAPNIAANDMLFIHMGNQVFILGALIGFITRFFYNKETIDADDGFLFILFSSYIFFAIIYLAIFLRIFWKEKQVNILKRTTYIAAVVIVHGFLAAVINAFLIVFYIGT